ncbi:gag-protease polyprotein [Cucumis melo var. makuwa]|uniref:Gag-protease polyprotein n=1 Tax=Cucumis melo var. makuwa TaxID=1194695 RepID=A0A5A7VQ71_CUCMM|nr:gag-protease polyprotein [Cucumis melo var. makuwa]
MPDVRYIVVMLMGYVVDWNCMSMDLKVLRLDGLVWTEGTRLICASFGSARLICASLEITRLIGVSFGITRLIRASFGITRLICAFYRTTRLICKGTARGRPTRGRKDAWYQSLSFRFYRLTYDVSLCFVSLLLKRSLPLVREMPPRRGARRGARGGRGRGAGRVQPEVQPVAQATDPVAPVTHADLAAMEQRSIVSRGQAPEGFQECPEDQKVQCAFFMLTDRGTAWWETTERMLGGDVSQITWQQFKKSFYVKFFSASLRDAKRQEFLNLEQGDMTVE